MSDVKNLVVRLDREIYDLLIKYCEENGLTMHTVITKAVLEYCSEDTVG